MMATDTAAVGLAVATPRRGGRVAARTPPHSVSVLAKTLLARLSVLVLVGFHIWLLWTQVVEGRVLEPGVALRWLAALLIAAGFLVLRRMGVPLVWGRHAVVLWLLVGLLHCQAMAPSDSGLLDVAQLPEATATLAGLAANAFGAVLGVLLFATLACRAALAAAPRLLPGLVHAAGGRLAVGHFLQVTCRPPPALIL